MKLTSYTPLVKLLKDSETFRFGGRGIRSCYNLLFIRALQTCKTDFGNVTGIWGNCELTLRSYRSMPNDTFNLPSNPVSRDSEPCIESTKGW
jgi:hypothetical protein